MSEKDAETPEFRGETFGEIAVAEKFVTQAQVEHALSIQQKMRDLGIQPKLIGEILSELGHLDVVKRDRVLQIKRKKKGRFAIEGFEIFGKLGKGSSGAVFKARQKSLDRIVALKVLKPRLAENESYLARFIREAKAVARLNHINVISAYDVGASHGYRFLVMEYIDGVTLATVLRRGGLLEEDRALKIARQIARALEHAHQNNLVHRDVKPDNIIMTEEGVAKLCDLGLAKDIDTEVVSGTGAGVHGTPSYISPEQAKGEHDIDIRCDTYSLGATLFHMVTGEVPFHGSTPSEVMAKHVTERLREPRSVHPELSMETSRLIQTMMAKKRADRPQSPTELLELIEVILTKSDPHRLSPSQLRHGLAPTSRKRRRRS